MPRLKDLSFPEAKEALLLIGLDASDAFIVEEVRRGRPSDPVAFKVPLGWALTGPKSQRQDTVFPMNFKQTSDQSLHESLEHMWKTEFEDTSLPSDTDFSQEDNLHWRLCNQECNS